MSAGLDGGVTSSEEEWKLLERFWVKHNKVVLDNAAISQEKFHLEQENAKLKQLLKQYLDGVSVNNDVMATNNNLLQASRFKNVVSMADGARSTRGGNITITDGNKVVGEVVRQRAY